MSSGNPFDFTNDPAPDPPARSQPPRRSNEPRRRAPREQDVDDRPVRRPAPRKSNTVLIVLGIVGGVVALGLVSCCVLVGLIGRGGSGGEGGGAGGENSLQALKSAQQKDIVFSDVLDAEFSRNEAAADLKYKDKYVVVEGTVDRIEKDLSSDYSVCLKGHDTASVVKCKIVKSQLNEVAALRPGDVVRVRGKCTGLAFNLLMKDCVFVKVR